MFESLTLIEPPLFGLAGEDPDVQELLGGLGQLMEKGPEGAPPEVEGMLVLQKLSAERGFPPPPPMRPPFEAQIDFDAIRSAEAPVMVVSGDHHPGWERTCDALASLLDAKRAVFAGSGHAPQRADGFNEASSSSWPKRPRRYRALAPARNVGALTSHTKSKRQTSMATSIAAPRRVPRPWDSTTTWPCGR